MTPDEIASARAVLARYDARPITPESAAAFLDELRAAFARTRPDPCDALTGAVAYLIWVLHR